MSWTETAQILGGYGEFVGAIAVVITLIFLSVQVRLNKIATTEGNALARTAAIDQIYEQFKCHRLLIASDADVARLWLEGRQGEELERIDNLRFEQLAIDYIIIFSNWAQRGMAIGNEQLVEMAVLTLSNSIVGSPGLDRVWRGGVVVDESFVRAVDKLVAKKRAD